MPDADRRRESMRAQYPGAAAAYDWALTAFGRPAWVSDGATGHEMGRRLPDRRTGPVPPIPWIPGGRTEP